MNTDQCKPAPAPPSGGAEASLELAIERSLEQAKRAFALQNFEQSVEHYAIALLMMKKNGYASSEIVDLYFAYGKALLENAIAQNSVLGQEETAAAFQGDEDENKASGSGLNASDTRIHFGEDAILETDNDALESGEIDREEQTVDLFADAERALPDEGVEGDNAESGDDEEGDGEPQDDFNAAWEILEVARSLYEAQKDPDNEVKLKLADTYIALGDVSLETEKLEQAVSDYNAAVTLKSGILPLSSRQIAEVHYKLCIVYDMTPGRLAHAIKHAKKAEASVQARLDEVTKRLKAQSERIIDIKGKGKASSNNIGSELSLDDMSKAQLESEVKELRELLEDVSLKIEELKSSPDMAQASAPDLVAQALDRDLNGAASASSSSKQASSSKQVNDLTSMVVKKKRKAPESTTEKADDNETTGSPEKKIQVDGGV